MKRWGVTAVIALALASVSGVVWAYIHSTGSGSGTASVTNLSAVTITSSTATPSTALLPGTSADATFRITNPNSVSLTIVSVVANGSLSATGAVGCTGVNSAVTFSDQSGLSILVPANATNYAIDLPSAVAMGSSSSNSCQGATFDIPVLVSVHRG